MSIAKAMEHLEVLSNRLQQANRTCQNGVAVAHTFRTEAFIAINDELLQVKWALEDAACHTKGKSA